MDRQIRLNAVYIKAVCFTFSLFIAPRDCQSRILYRGESVNDRGTWHGGGEAHAPPTIL